MTNRQHGYVNSEYLSAAGELFSTIKTRSYSLMGDIEGKPILDIGCGSGVDTVAMARFTGSKGLVHGVDFDPDMIQRANHHADLAGLSTCTQHQCADAYQLPFQDNSFYATRSERLFMHLSQPDIALAEAIRVTRPGGRVVLVDTDWGSLSAHTGFDDIERRVAIFRAEHFLPNGYSGRRLFALMSAAGLEQLHVETSTLHTADLALWRFLTLTESVSALAVERGALTREDRLNWNQSMERTFRARAFFGSVNIVLACGAVSA